MARVGTSNLNLGTWTDGENPGAGSQTVDNPGLNGDRIKLDVAVGTEHTAAGAHKSNVIDKGNLKTTVADGSTIEKDGTVGLRVKALGITGAELATGAVTAGKIATGGVSATAQLAANVVETATIKDASVTVAKLATDAVETVKIKDANVTTAKLEYKEYVAVLSQAGTSAPAVVVVKNTLSGSPTWARDGVGSYSMNLGSAFTASKTTVTITQGYLYGVLLGRRVDANNVGIYSFNSSAALADSIVNEATLIVRVYP